MTSISTSSGRSTYCVSNRKITIDEQIDQLDNLTAPQNVGNKKLVALRKSTPLKTPILRRDVFCDLGLLGYRM